MPPALPRHATRIAAGLGAGALAWVAWATLGPEPPYAPALLAAITAVAVSLFPRAAWIASAIAIVGWLGLASDARPGAALLVRVGALACPILLPRSRPAVVGARRRAAARSPRARRLPTRRSPARCGGGAARLARALGFWWLALAEPLTRSTLFFGSSDGTHPRATWEASASDAAHDALVPLLSSGALAGAALFAGFATVLPWIVRGRWLAADVVAATVWAAGLAAGAGALGQALGTAVAMPEPRGAVAGAVLAGMVAVLCARLRLAARVPEVPLA